MYSAEGGKASRFPDLHAVYFFKAWQTPAEAAFSAEDLPGWRYSMF